LYNLFRCAYASVVTLLWTKVRSYPKQDDTRFRRTRHLSWCRRRRDACSAQMLVLIHRRTCQTNAALVYPCGTVRQVDRCVRWLLVCCQCLVLQITAHLIIIAMFKTPKHTNSHAYIVILNLLILNFILTNAKLNKLHSTSILYQQ